MKSREKNKEQLRKDLQQMLFVIKSTYSNALKYDFESEERIAYSNNIASSLRAIVYGDRSNNYKSLIQRTGLNNKLLFPVYNTMISLNLLPTYNLLQFSVNNSGVRVSISDDVISVDRIYYIYMSFDSWLNEIVIDTKLKDVEPLSRLLIIKSVADTMGAHVDNKVEEHIFNMSQHDLLPIVVNDNNESSQIREIKAKSIFCETILAIARELLDSYDIWEYEHPILMDKTDYTVRVQKYEGGNKRFELLKYGFVPKSCPFNVKTYNSNSYYECEVYSKDAMSYKIKRKSCDYIITIFDYKDIFDGEYLGKSIYPTRKTNMGSDSIKETGSGTGTWIGRKREFTI